MLPGIDYIGIAVSFMCHDGQGNFLFHKRSQTCRDEKGKWDWGSGKIEFGEEVEEALRREVREEYGCEILEITEVLPVTSWKTKVAGQDSHWLTVTHIVKVDRNEAKLNEPRSMSEIGWFRLDNLPSPLHKGIDQKMEIFFNSHFKKYI